MSGSPFASHEAPWQYDHAWLLSASLAARHRKYQMWKPDPDVVMERVARRIASYAEITDARKRRSI